MITWHLKLLGVTSISGVALFFFVGIFFQELLDKMFVFHFFLCTFAADLWLTDMGIFAHQSFSFKYNKMAGCEARHFFVYIYLYCAHFFVPLCLFFNRTY